MTFVKFMSSTTGRWVRIVLGLVIIALGLAVVKDVAGIILAVLGLVPLLSGIFDFCVLAPFFGVSFSGREIRNQSPQ